MLMAQILGLKSLREIEQAQKSKQKRLCHLGVKSPVSRSALSRMNDERSADFFKDVFQQMLQSCKALAPGSQFKLPGVNSLILMDATTIQLCLDVFPWATYTQTKGALKLHFGLNDMAICRTSWLLLQAKYMRSMWLKVSITSQEA